MPLLLEIEGLSMPILGREGELMDDDTGDTCGRGGGGWGMLISNIYMSNIHLIEINKPSSNKHLIKINKHVKYTSY